jgi:hypothetical protein
VPTYELLETFLRDLDQLTPDQRRALGAAVRRFLQDLPSRRFRKGLRVKRVRGAGGIFEMTWAPDGRATFRYGPEVIEGQPHVIWRRVGTHAILSRP